MSYYTGPPTQLRRRLRLRRRKPPSPRHCLGLLAPTCMLLQGKERERAAYFLRPNTQRFLALGVVMGRFVPWLHNTCRLGVPNASQRGTGSEVAHKWAEWLHNPCHLGGPQRFRAGDKIRKSPQVGRVAT